MTRNKIKKTTNSTAKIAVAIISCSFVFMVFFFLGYYPFCKLNMLESDYETPNGVYENVHDRIHYIKKYMKMMYVTKGKLYEFVDHNGKRVSVQMGWDNCIHIKKGNEEKIISVKRMQYFHGKAPILNRHGDSIVIDKNIYREFNGTELMGNKSDDRVCIYKQPNDLPFGNQKYGFVINAEDWTLMSGQVNLFDY